MDITTAESLGDKLAALDLTDDEAALLGTALGPAPDAEVDGFSFQEVQFTLMPVVRVRAGKSFGWGETNDSLRAGEGQQQLSDGDTVERR